MSLKLVTRPRTQFFHLQGTLCGRRIRESTGTTDRRQAEEYKAKREAEIWQESIYGQKAVITFAHAVAAYLEAEPRSETTKFHLRRLLDYFGERKLLEIAQPELDDAYRHILRDGINASPATKMRGVLTPLRAVLEFAAIRRWCDRPAFSSPSIPKGRTTYLRPEEVDRLIVCAAEHVQPLLIFLAGTGARLAEALELQWQDVDLKGRRAVLWQKQGNERHIDLPPVVMRALEELPWKTGTVFRTPRGQKTGEGYYNNGRTSGGQIKRAWATACKRAGLAGRMRVWVPKGQTREKQLFVPEATPHDLRHTWATWHYCVHKDLLRLRDDGGWSTITMVTRYAKKMPDAYRGEILDFLSGKRLTPN